MNVVETKRTDSRRIRPKILQEEASAKDAAVEQQLAEVERTLTDRWEW